MLWEASKHMDSSLILDVTKNVIALGGFCPVVLVLTATVDSSKQSKASYVMQAQHLLLQASIPNLPESMYGESELEVEDGAVSSCCRWTALRTKDSS